MSAKQIVRAAVCGLLVLGACGRRPQRAGTQPSGAAPAKGAPGQQSPLPPPTSDAIVNQYLIVQSALSRDSTEGIDAAVDAMGALLDVVAADDRSRARDVLEAARALKGASLVEARQRLRSLGEPMARYRARRPEVLAKTILVRCPMEAASSVWVQARGPIANPYLGTRMQSCGTIAQGPTWIDVEPIVREHCARCHGPDPRTDTPARRRRVREAMEHLDMSIYPFRTHHSDALDRIVEALTPGRDGDVTMPLDSPGDVPDAHLALVLAWARAGGPAWDGTLPTHRGVGGRGGPGGHGHH